MIEKFLKTQLPTADCRLPVFPPAGYGQSIGLFGGSFNPPHDGHRHVSLMVLRRLGLSKIWWLVTPGNPLKDASSTPNLSDRVKAAQRMASHPRLVATGLEAQLGTVFTVDTLKKIKQRRPDLNFVWIMGADNLAQFHRWKGWRQIARLMPVVIVDRPGFTHKACRSPAGTALSATRRSDTKARVFARSKPPVLLFLHGKRSSLSSTFLRKSPVLKENAHHLTKNH